MSGPIEKKKDRANANSGNGKPKLPEPKTDIIRKHRKVLFVDDEEAMVLLHKRMIERRESTVSISIATSGKEALKILSKEGICLVVTDFNMPGMDGIELSSKMREMFPDIKIIVTTTHIDEAKIKAEKSGLDGLVFIAKTPGDINAFYMEILENIYK